MKFSSYLPCPFAIRTQGFGQNANTLYKEDGLKGHPAIDFGMNYGDPIRNCVEGAYVYSTLNRDNPDLMRYRAVYTIWDDPDSNTSYEVVYGHCSDIQVQVGTYPKVGEIIALAGNTGDVYSNGTKVTAEQKNMGTKAGTHLHFQVRLCKRVTSTPPGKHYIEDGNGILKRDGFYYEVPDFDNGFNGCIDPEPFLNGFPAKDYEPVVSTYQALLNTLKALVGALFRSK